MTNEDMRDKPSGRSALRKARLAEDTAARPILNPEELLDDQKKILKRILHKIRDFAHEEGHKEGSRDKLAYRRELHSRRPRQVFFIDGARGAGKTSLLLTLREYLAYLGDESRWLASSCHDSVSIPDVLETFARRVLEEGNPDRSPDAQQCRTFYACPVEVGVAKRRVACSLEVLYPSDLEGGQPVMEGIFAFMNQRLAKERERLKQEGGGDWSGRANVAKALQDRLVRSISPGWYLSKNEGKDAIIRDSSDYENFLEKMGTASVRAFARVSDFREFVLDYLDFFNAELLVIFFDDTDVTPQVTRDMLHTIRIFLDHPRIVTVIAGHLKSMRQSLVWEYLRDIKESIDAVTNAGGSAVTEWRQFQQQQVEEYLEKVLPRQFRNLIHIDRAHDTNEIERHGGNADTKDDPDRNKVFGGKTFGAFCSDMQDLLLPAFVRGKQRAYYNDTINHLEISDVSHGVDLENWMAWYLLRHHYTEQLKPRSVRVQVTMTAIAKPKSDSPVLSDRLPSEFHRRLAVFLFENPDNFELIQRFGDADTHVMRWLRRQHLNSRWIGERYFEINGTKIYEGTYSYSFISFRVDLGISIPIRENTEDRMPAGLLGKPSGPNLIADRPFYPGMHRQRLFGVAAIMRHSVIPANCFYLWDLHCLPDVAWQDEANPKNNPWGSRLIYEWPNLFVFETSDWDRNEHTKREESGDTFGTELKNYLVKVLVPLASVDLGAFVPSLFRLQDYSDARRDAQIQPLLRDEMEFRDELQVILAEADTIRRRYDYLETIGKESSGWSSVSEASQALITEWSGLLLHLLLPDALDERKEETHDKIANLLARDRERRPSLGRASVGSTGRGKQKPSETQRPPEKATEPDRMRASDVASMLRRQLRSYQWILNDLRRAHHAARIFSNDSGPTLRQLEAELGRHPDQQHKGQQRTPRAIPRTRRDLFRRSDRYTVVTGEAIDRWLKPTEERLSALLETPAASHCTSEDIDECAGCDLDADLRDLYEAKPGEFSHTNLATGVEKTDTAGWLVPLSRSSPDCSEFRVATHTARLARSYFMFVVALAPCLPAIIHIDVASRMYASNGKWRDDTWGTLAQWDGRIKRFERFVRNYRRLLENMKFRLDILQLCQLSGRDAKASGLPATLEELGARLTLVPDFSFGSLGVRGLMQYAPKGCGGRFPLEFTEQLARLNEPFKSWTQDRQRKERDARSFVNLSLFQDVAENFGGTKRFVLNLRETLVRPWLTSLSDGVAGLK